MPMFPLGSVLFPAMPLALRVFEERYLKMMGSILEDDEPRFGVVLIERGSEVGGGDKRFHIGTLARVLQVEAPDGPLQVMARGGDRFSVTKWLDDEPFPRAEIEFLPELDEPDEHPKGLDDLETTVREALEYLEGEKLSPVWPADIELSDDPMERAWQLAGISPLGPLDHQDLLECDSLQELVSAARVTLVDAMEMFRLSRENPL
jgi:Lon protease-like protein